MMVWYSHLLKNFPQFIVIHTVKAFDIINEYSKVAGYKIHTQKSLAFLYTNNEKIEELRK